MEAIDKKQAILSDENGNQERVDISRPQLFDYAHVTTTYSSQGLTCDRVIALTHSNISKESLYVLTSRARQEVEIVTDSKEKLLAKASRTSTKANVLDGFKLEGIENQTKQNSFDLEIGR